MTASECLRVAIGPKGLCVLPRQCTIYFRFYGFNLFCGYIHIWDDASLLERSCRESLVWPCVCNMQCVCVALKLLSFGRFTCGFGCLHRVFAKSNSNIHSSDRMPLPCPKPHAYNLLLCYAMSSSLSEQERRADEWTNFAKLIYLIEII